MNVSEIYDALEGKRPKPVSVGDTFLYGTGAAVLFSILKGDTVQLMLGGK